MLPVCDMLRHPMHVAGLGHDEGDLAFKPEELSQVQSIFTQATDFDSEIWGVKFKIPFDPNYGPNWGACETPIFEEI